MERTGAARAASIAPAELEEVQSEHNHDKKNDGKDGFHLADSEALRRV
jgi:hypothetical protein